VALFLNLINRKKGFLVKQESKLTSSNSNLMYCIFCIKHAQRAVLS
jgi:hypothetical protein